MNFLSAQQDNIEMLLTQMGADVKSIHGLVCFVRFSIEDTEFFYVYNLNAKNKYYLQKVLPYPVGAGEFSKPSEIVKYIKKDMEAFRKVSKGENFKNFVNAGLELHHTIHKVEETFLNYDVSNENMDEFLKKINEINEVLTKIQNTEKTI